MYGPDVGEFGNIDTRGPAELLPGERVVSVEAAESGPVRSAVEIVSGFRGSMLIRRVVLYHGSPMVHFEFTRDWKTDCADVIVKAMFPLAIEHPLARSEIPYGSVERPADGAEVPAQTWLNLDEADGSYGVALLNNGRYGHSVKGATIGFSLLRDPPTGPDPQPEDAGEGNHVLTYALYPHAGDWRKAEVLKRAWELNAPPLARGIGGGAPPFSSSPVIRVEPASVVVGAVKREQNGTGVVLRLVETEGRPARATVSHTLPPKTACRANILEDAGEPLAVSTARGLPVEGVHAFPEPRAFEIDLAPFGIETVILRN
jgi:alpha-mannosidase